MNYVINWGKLTDYLIETYKLTFAFVCKSISNNLNTSEKSINEKPDKYV